jgi:hypothetical protein
MFKCNCPHEVRAGCFDRDCPHTIFRPSDDPSPYDWEDIATEPTAVYHAVLANRRSVR